MDYNLLVCISDKQWVAIDVDSQGECDRISFHGNDSMLVETGENVSGFCTELRDYYNIELFNDIELNVVIVTVSEYSEYVEELFSQLKGAKSVNVIDAKRIIPIYVLKNTTVKPQSVINVTCLEVKFSMHVDDRLLVSYTEGETSEDVIMDPENFSFLFMFDCGNLTSDDNELKVTENKYKKELEEKQKEVEKYKKEYSDLEKKFEMLNLVHILRSSMEEKASKYNEKRILYRFSKDRIKGKYNFNVDDETKKYKCKIYVTDGEVVSKGKHLIKISEEGERYFTIVGSALSNVTGLELTGRQSIIKAEEDVRVFLLVNDDDLVKDNQALLIVSDPSDTREAVMKWYEEMK